MKILKRRKEGLSLHSLFLLVCGGIYHAHADECFLFDLDSPQTGDDAILIPLFQTPNLLLRGAPVSYIRATVQSLDFRIVGVDPFFTGRA